jgi:hypothetical protein
VKHRFFCLNCRRWRTRRICTPCGPSARLLSRWEFAHKAKGIDAAKPKRRITMRELTSFLGTSEPCTNHRPGNAET